MHDFTRWILRALFLFGIFLIMIYSCKEEEDLPDYKINLRWSVAYENESIEDVKLGFAWALSYLGANLPVGTMIDAIVWKSDKIFEFDVSKAGFNSDALDAFSIILPQLRKSEEYLMMGGIDLGRFIILTLNTTPHYYQITGAKRTFNEFKKNYTFENEKVAVIASRIALDNRLLEITQTNDPDKIAFIAYEGVGRLDSNTFSISEIEVMDLLPNGQPKFALYNLDGSIKNGASTSLTRAGKPAKCIWCHDGTFQPIFDPQPEVDGYRSWEFFNELIKNYRDLISNYKANLETDIDLSIKQDHTFMELLYLSFMEPSAYRLASEWGMSEAQVKEVLNGFSTHPHSEFAFLGTQLYDRHKIDQFAPYDVLSVPESPRETSEFEPDFFH